MLAKHSSTTLIAKDITKRRGVMNHFYTIVDTGVCTRTKYTGYTPRMATQSTAGGKQIAMSLDGLSCGKRLAQQTLHTLLYLRAHTTAIKIDSTNLYTTQLGEQIVTENTTNLIIGYMKRIETHSMDLYAGVAIVRKANPISLGTTTISYQYRH